MPKTWTIEDLRALSHEAVHNLWLNAKAKNAKTLITIIEESGLPYHDPHGLKLDSPIGRAINEIVNSPTGIAAAIEATERGQPALAGIDPLLFAQLGRDYAATYEATIQAGYLVAKMMRARGYFETGVSGPILGGVAKSGAIYRRR